ncbi:MAG: hypothetical protein QOH23_2211, partial [Gaiellaceae bacterium]|nr:hypothetical protein [Gaiellaceae bacterium]
MIAAATLAAVALAAPGATSAPARVSLLASPTHVKLVPGGRQVVHVTAAGGGPLLIDARIAGYRLDLQGRPHVAKAADAAAWLSVSPRRFTVGRGGGVLVVSSRRPAHAEPGDHSAVVLLSAVVPSARGVVVRMRIGLAVSVRVAGRVLHRVAVVGARTRSYGRAKMLELTLANRGNVIELVPAGDLRIVLVRRGQVVARYLVGRRELLPRTRGLVRLLYRGHDRGGAVARVR